MKGAFSGAHIDKNGYFYSADKGSLFLDEVGEIELKTQVKLLRALENGEYIPIGDTQPQRSDVRIISWNRKKTSTRLGVDSKTLYRKMKKIGLS